MRRLLKIKGARMLHENVKASQSLVKKLQEKKYISSTHSQILFLIVKVKETLGFFERTVIN